MDSEEQMVTYINNSTAYIPDTNILGHGLRAVLLEPPSTVLEGPDCDFLVDQGTKSQIQCNQVCVHACDEYGLRPVVVISKDIMFKGLEYDQKNDGLSKGLHKVQKVQLGVIVGLPLKHLKAKK